MFDQNIKKCRWDFDIYWLEQFFSLSNNILSDCSELLKCSNDESAVFKVLLWGSGLLASKVFVINVQLIDENGLKYWINLQSFLNGKLNFYVIAVLFYL